MELYKKRRHLYLVSIVENVKTCIIFSFVLNISSSDGAGRSGTYIAISNLVDRVKVVQVIDVFQCIKLIRGKRPQFVETVVTIFHVLHGMPSRYKCNFNCIFPWSLQLVTSYILNPPTASERSTQGYFQAF